MVGSLPALWRYVRCPPMKLHRPLAYRATASTKEAQAPALWRAIELLIFRIDKVEDAVRYDKVTPPTLFRHCCRGRELKSPFERTILNKEGIFIAKLPRMDQCGWEGQMLVPFKDWLDEQEHKRPPLVFFAEWALVFALALPFWVVILLEIQGRGWSLAGSIAFASLYASGMVYVRLLKVAPCRKCGAPLSLTQETLGRRTIHQIEKCIEIERGGEEWYGHFLDIYSRRYSVEIVKYRCRWCGRVWDERVEDAAEQYKLVRTIEVKD